MTTTRPEVLTPALIGEAVRTGIDFWTWWDADPDSDQKLSSNPADALTGTLNSQIFDGAADGETIETVVEGTNALVAARLLGVAKDPRVFLDGVTLFTAAGHRIEPEDGMFEGMSPDGTAKILDLAKLIVNLSEREE